MVEIAYADVGEEYQHDQKKRGEISLGELRRSGTCDAIRIDIFQRVTWDTRDSFAGVEKMICKTFLPRLFFGKTKHLSPIVGALSTMLTRKDGLGLLNIVTSAQEKYLSSTQGSAELTRDVMGGGELSNADHLQTLSKEQFDGKEAQDVA